jgi:hypothetical protein
MLYQCMCALVERRNLFPTEKELHTLYSGEAILSTSILFCSYSATLRLPFVVFLGGDASSLPTPLHFRFLAIEERNGTGIRVHCATKRRRCSIPLCSSSSNKESSRLTWHRSGRARFFLPRDDAHKLTTGDLGIWFPKGRKRTRSGREEPFDVCPERKERATQR